MKKTNEDIRLIEKSTKEIFDNILDIGDSLKRVPTKEEMLHWQMEIDRAILSKNKNVIDAGLTISGAYFEVLDRLDFTLKT